jgi:hypothetical protein
MSIVFGFVIVLIVMFYLFRLKRKREMAEFKEANFADFVEFEADQPKTSGGDDAVTEIAASVISAAATTIDERNNPVVDLASTSNETFQLRDSLYDEVTRSFLANLYRVLGDNYSVIPKLRLSDLINGGRESGKPFGVLTESIDFTICDKADLTVLCCIQLSGGSGEHLEKIFSQLGVPLLNLSVGVSYSELEIKDYLDGIVTVANPPGQCRNCMKDMVIKMVSRGKNEGQYFWVCKHCRLTVPVR